MELIDIVDTNNKVIGDTDVETAHRMQLLHRVIGIFIFDYNGYLYSQKHEKYKLYDNSVGGHIKKGETENAAAKRELKEELNIEIPIIKLATFFSEKSRLGHVWTIFEGVLPINWKFKKTKEVKYIEKRKITEWTKLMLEKPELFTQGIKNTMSVYLKIKSNKKNKETNYETI